MSGETKARAADITEVIVTKVRAQDFTEGGGSWQVGVPEVSKRSQVTPARAKMDKAYRIRSQSLA